MRDRLIFRFRRVPGYSDVIEVHVYGLCLVFVPSRWILSPQATRNNTSAKDLQGNLGLLHFVDFVPDTCETYQSFDA